MRSTASMAAALFMAAVIASAEQTQAGFITANGAVTALNDISQMTNIYGTADFDGGVSGELVPLTAYTSAGLTFHTGSLDSILPGVTTSGFANQPGYFDFAPSGFFSGPIAGGGSASGLQTFFAGVATFSIPVTQVGLTASSLGEQYLTAWDTAGQLLGQVDWIPSADSAFIGLDTGDVAIGMIAYGNQDLYNGGEYASTTTLSDNWVWNSSSMTAPVPEPGTLAIFGIGALGLGVVGIRRRKQQVA